MSDSRVSREQIINGIRIARHLSQQYAHRFPNRPSLAHDELFSESLVSIAAAAKGFQKSRKATWETFVYKAVERDIWDLIDKHRIPTEMLSSVRVRRGVIRLPTRGYRRWGYE